MRRIAHYFDYQVENLGMEQLLDYFNDLLKSRSWSTVKLDLYGLRSFYTNVLHETWENIPLVKKPIERGGIQTTISQVVKNM